MTRDYKTTAQEEQMIKLHTLLVFFGFAAVRDLVSYEELLYATEELKAEFMTEADTTETQDRGGEAFWRRWLSLSHEQRRFLLDMEELRQDPQHRAQVLRAYHPKRTAKP